MKISETTIQLGVCLAVTLMAMPELSFAQTGDTGLAGVAEGVQSNQLAPISNLIAATSFVIAIFMAILGIIDFKKHADAPTNNPISKGVTKVVGAGALASVGYGLNTLDKTMDEGSQANFNTTFSF